MNVAALRDEQRPDGLFRAAITHRDGRVENDANGFVTAIVLRRLRHSAPVPGLDAVIARALDGLQRCAAPGLPGAYGFWPADERPGWARAVPADIDDTALILAELYRHGRIDRPAVLREIVKAMLPWRVPVGVLGTLPPWVAEGSFLTWIAPRGANIVDACVNANAAALMAMAGAAHLPGYDAAVRTVLAGLDWAGDAPARLDALTPFYPSPAALLEAVEHAVECGAAALAPAARRLRALAPSPQRGLCRDAYGRTYWHAPAAEIAAAWPRALAA